MTSANSIYLAAKQAVESTCDQAERALRTAALALAHAAETNQNVKPAYDEVDKALREIVAVRGVAHQELNDLKAAFRCAWMGDGRVAVGQCKDKETGSSGIVYLEMGEQRSLNADTSDLFPVGSTLDTDRILACIYFKTANSVLQSIDVLTELLADEFGEQPAGSRNAFTQKYSENGGKE